MRIVVTGSIAFDYLMVFPGRFKEHILPDKMDVLSVSFLVELMKRQHGGTAPNIAYNLALLGERPIVMGTVGEDFAEYRLWLEAAWRRYKRDQACARASSPLRVLSIPTSRITRSQRFILERCPRRTRCRFMTMACRRQTS